MRGKAQSAMEFLMTYGWAVLIMLVVVAVLFMLGVFNPQTAATNSCTLQPGFSCYGYALRDGGVLSLDMGQATGGDIVITNVGCSAKDTGPFLNTSMSVRIQSGKHKNFTALPQCEKADGTFPAAGEFYRGVLYITYRDDRTGITHKVTGDISYHVEGVGGGGGGGGGTPTPPPGAILIDSCPYTISSTGYYYLDSDLPQYSDTCITITASDSVLNCQDHSITGTQYIGYGIYLQGATGISVSNCNVSGFYSGIYVEGSNGCTITDNRLTSNNMGMFVTWSSGCSVTGNNASSNQNCGIYMDGTTSSAFEDNDATSNSVGLLFSQSSGNTLSGNTATGNTDYDFQCYDERSNSDGGNTCDSQGYCDTWLVTCPAGSSAICTNPITGCCIISSLGIYSLADGITAYTNCIRIFSSDVTLDCGEKTITAGADYISAIYIRNDSSRVTVRDCVLDNFNVGVNAGHPDGSYTSITVTGNTIYLAPYGMGVLFKYVNDSEISWNTVDGTGAGSQEGQIALEVISSPGNLIANNNLTFAAAGISLALSGEGRTVYSDWNRVEGNNVTQMRSGITTNYASNNSFASNRAYGNGVGINIGNGADSNLSGNFACGNTNNLACSPSQNDRGGNICTQVGCGISCSPCPS